MFRVRRTVAITVAVLDYLAQMPAGAPPAPRTGTCMAPSGTGAHVAGVCAHGRKLSGRRGTQWQDGHLPQFRTDASASAVRFELRRTGFLIPCATNSAYSISLQCSTLCGKLSYLRRTLTDGAVRLSSNGASTRTAIFCHAHESLAIIRPRSSDKLLLHVPCTPSGWSATLRSWGVLRGPALQLCRSISQNASDLGPARRKSEQLPSAA